MSTASTTINKLAVDSVSASSTATTTFYSNVAINGNISYSGAKIGGMKVCKGALIFPTSGTGETVVNCGFQPSVVQVNAFMAGGAGNSTAYSYGTYDGLTYSTAGIAVAATPAPTSTTAWIVYLKMVAAEDNYVYGTSTITSTGFKFGYTTSNPNAAACTYVAY
jgi:hypothetical protein